MVAIAAAVAFITERGRSGRKLMLMGIDETLAASLGVR